MNVSIVGRKVKITSQIRQYIEKNMKKLDHHVDHILDFKIVLKRERQMFFAEVNIHVKGKVIHIFAKNHDLFSVIDVLYDKIEQKLKRHREKLTNHRVIPLKETIAAVENELESPEPQEWEAAVNERGR